ncbi:amidohydrolase [Grimontia sp. S25]|uniref:Amidohydrolase n=1 Tax=Grimontia sedimenti TaxID=2711294 RepID=A0A6M1RDL3_9GAMM|nr:amidohydrolase [Grimontia sedimenti]NGN98406.1 amidohydrolase [Grimontia sedimenti]
MNKNKLFKLLPIAAILATAGCTKDNEVAGPEAVIYTNGDILTMNKAAPNAEAVVVVGEDIVAVGSLSDLQKEWNNHTIFDLQGKTLMPGLVETHHHIMMEAAMMDFLDMSYQAEPDFDKMLEIFAAGQPLAEDNAFMPGWVIGLGWDAGKHGRVPTLEERDALFPDTPVFVAMQGHGGWYNSKGMELKGITKDKEPPRDSAYVKDENGELTGEISGLYAVLEAIGSYPGPRLDTAVKATHKAASQGFTTVSDIGADNVDNLKVLSEASLDENFNVRVAVGVTNADGYLDILSNRADFETDKVWISQTKMWLDGAVHGGNIYTDLEYQNDAYKHNKLAPWGTQEMFNDVAWNSVLNGVNYSFHANGNLSLEMGLNAVEYARERAKAEGIDDTNFKGQAIHLSISTPEQYARMAELGVEPTFIIGHTYWAGGQIMNQYFLKHAQDYMFRVNTAFEAGLPVSLHNDAPVTPALPWLGIETSVTRVTEDGNLLNPSEAITVQQALEAYTINGAIQFGVDDMTGSLEPGKRADMIVIDRNPLKVEPDTIRDTQVEITIFEGRVVYERS